MWPEMIRNIEIQEAARAWGLRPDIVEKDYVLGWLLMGLSAHPRLQTQWIFKGGPSRAPAFLRTQHRTLPDQRLSL